MKNSILLLGVCALLAACGSEPKKRESGMQTAASAELNSDSISGANLAAVAHQPQVDTSITKIGTAHTGGLIAKGVKLMSASDCTSCHKENEKLIGPSYQDIARKYPSNDANIAMLAGKIIQGGKGNWGEIPMTPHPNVSVEDAKEMTRYILSVR